MTDDVDQVYDWHICHLDEHPESDKDGSCACCCLYCLDNNPYVKDDCAEHGEEMQAEIEADPGEKEALRRVMMQHKNRRLSA